MVERISIARREQWLEIRKHDVTASVAGSLLGVHDYVTPYQLFHSKAGNIEEDPEITPAMERGRVLERPALDLYRKLRPETAIDWNGEPGGLAAVYLRDPAYRLGATVDAYAVDRRGPGIVQFKSVEASIFRRKWRTRDDSDEYEISCPLGIAAQAIVEADLAGAKWAEVAALVVGFGVDMHILEIPLHAGVLAKVRELSLDFWDRIKRNDPPPADYAKDGDTVKALYSDTNGRTIDLRSDNRLPGALAEREVLSGQRKEIESRLESIKTEIQEKMGPNETALVQGWQITNKLQHRKEFVAKATSFRVVRAKRVE